MYSIGTSVEHHTLYQYQFSSTKNIFMGQIQTETAYYQPNPPATMPFAYDAMLKDPNFASICANNGNATCNGYGVRVVDSDLLIYGAGLYSFFNNYDTSCEGPPAACQKSIFSIEGSGSITAYNLNTVGATSMIDKDGISIAAASDNVNTDPGTIALYRSS